LSENPPGNQKYRCADGLLDVRDQIKPQLCVKKMKRFLNILKIKIVNYVYQTSYSSLIDELNFSILSFILFTLRESRWHPIFGVYPPLAGCQGFAVGNYSFTLGRLVGAKRKSRHRGSWGTLDFRSIEVKTTFPGPDASGQTLRNCLSKL
jgi:hypothetical protein